jgi:small subunit ribosomal protein S21
MLIVKLNDPKDIDRALKTLKYKFNKIGIVKELRERQAFKKPSAVRRDEILKAIYIEKKEAGETDEYIFQPIPTKNKK